MTVTIDAAGRGAKVTLAGPPARSPEQKATRSCVQATLSAARWPAPITDDTGAAEATLVVDLLVRPGGALQDPELSR